MNTPPATPFYPTNPNERPRNTPKPAAPVQCPRPS